jgi:hypothetical protein
VVPAVSFVAVLVALAFVFKLALREPSPLRVGATPDDVWTFISTNQLSPKTLHGLLPITRRTMWSADGSRIQSETRFRWRTNRLIAIRKTFYTYETNGTVQRVNSDLDLKWPF